MKRQIDLLYRMKELFFTLCNHVLIVKSDGLPFGVENSILLKNFFELFGSLSGRDRSGIRTEPMMVTVCGVAKGSLHCKSNVKRMKNLCKNFITHFYCQKL